MDVLLASSISRRDYLNRLMLLRRVVSNGVYYLRSHLTCCNKVGYVFTRHLHVPSVDELDSFGTYTLILPPESSINGVAHIPMKSVPEHINRPQYVSGTLSEINLNRSDPFAGDPHVGDGRIIPGSDDEIKLRRTAKLAKAVLDRTRDWVKVNYGQLYKVVMWSVLTHRTR